MLNTTYVAASPTRITIHPPRAPLRNPGTTPSYALCGCNCSSSRACRTCSCSLTLFPNHHRRRALRSGLLKARTLQADRGSSPTSVQSTIRRSVVSTSARSGSCNCLQSAFDTSFISRLALRRSSQSPTPKCLALSILIPKSGTGPRPFRPAATRVLAASTAPQDNVATARPNVHRACLLQHSLEVNLSSRGRVLRYCGNDRLTRCRQRRVETCLQSHCRVKIGYAVRPYWISLPCGASSMCSA
ncbi:uncharacterized protein CC84DRAFT_830205 [Paraphaeosphaeria sporulosa]|uniref:Uncharacterized protein n=1 Tax=Paraphaeosphaeria sporulosa TaxID=1460663 RepID=A0A177CEJ6_9PLEO|nr:uncharacterized protein CC84DRAFT_830205 [Paraphaeosphaeria sporulosa]OAG05160.1 hypothetical protein CC84DRAFT_830205 [Paraphaeosphaeria sporulosa]